MKLISWNIRGCNSELKQRLLRRKIQVEKLTIVFLQETKRGSVDLETFSKRLWKGATSVALDTKGVAGGIGILWNPNQVSLSNFVPSRNTLLAYFHVLGTVVRWVISNVYGPFQLAKKPKFLDELRALKQWVTNGHWIIRGDFNLI